MQVTLEEQMICGALQTLNEEAMEDVLQSEPPSHPGEPLRTIRESPSLASASSPVLPPTTKTSEDDLNYPTEQSERSDHVVINLSDEVFM